MKSKKSLFAAFVLLSVVLFLAGQPADPALATVADSGGSGFSTACGFSLGLGAALLGGGVTAVAGGVVLLWGSGFCLAAAFGH